jgi:hypothetical protein
VKLKESGLLPLIIWILTAWITLAIGIFVFGCASSFQTEKPHTDKTITAVRINTLDIPKSDPEPPREEMK